MSNLYTTPCIMMDQSFLCLKDDKTMYFALVRIRLEHVGQSYGGSGSTTLCSRSNFLTFCRIYNIKILLDLHEHCHDGSSTWQVSPDSFALTKCLQRWKRTLAWLFDTFKPCSLLSNVFYLRYSNVTLTLFLIFECQEHIKLVLPKT